MYTLNISTLFKGNITINFSNLDLFVKTVGMQIGYNIGYISDINRYLEHISWDFSTRFKEKENLGVFNNIKETDCVLDIGSGTSILDVIMYYYTKCQNIYLLDRNLTTGMFSQKHWCATAKEHGTYNNWAVLKDILKTNKINLDYFTILDPADDWPPKLDLIMSSYSYMWHYPKDVYWHKISKYKKANLCFDIINRKENYMEEINLNIKNVCNFTPKPKLYFHWFSNELLYEEGSPGKVCYWKRK